MARTMEPERLLRPCLAQIEITGQSMDAISAVHHLYQHPLPKLSSLKLPKSNRQRAYKPTGGIGQLV